MDGVKLTMAQFMEATHDLKAVYSLPLEADWARAYHQALQTLTFEALLHGSQKIVHDGSESGYYPKPAEIRAAARTLPGRFEKIPPAQQRTPEEQRYIEAYGQAARELTDGLSPGSHFGKDPAPLHLLMASAGEFATDEEQEAVIGAELHRRAQEVIAAEDKENEGLW